jgi:ankyrin repeat protein
MKTILTVLINYIFSASIFSIIFDVNVVPCFIFQVGLNALHLAAKEGRIQIVNELLRRGADVNAPTTKGNTALHIASLGMGI